MQLCFAPPSECRTPHLALHAMDVDSVAVAEAIRNRLQNPLEVSDVRPAYKNREEGTWSTIAPDSPLLLLAK